MHGGWWGPVAGVSRTCKGLHHSVVPCLVPRCPGALFTPKQRSDPRPLCQARAQEQPGNTLSVEAFQRLWRHSVLLLQRGFATGSILTVDEGEAPSLGPAWARRYIYNQARCGRCGGRVATWDMAGRTVYACARCQPLQAGTKLAEGRRAAVAAAAPARVGGGLGSESEGCHGQGCPLGVGPQSGGTAGVGQEAGGTRAEWAPSLGATVMGGARLFAASALRPCRC